ncbi:unnamed protein product [Caenorhabditis brenneri]
MGLCYSKLLKTTFKSSKYSYDVNWSPEWSTTPKTFHLLRLPLLALLEVLKSLDPIELFILSQCSRKAASCIHFVGSRKWKLSVDVREQTININDIYRVAITASSIKPTWKYDRRMKMLFVKYQQSENSKLELQKVLAQLQIAFRCPVTSFEYTDRWKSDQCWFSVLKCIVQNQVQPLESFVLTRTSKTEDLEWALQNVKVTQKIVIRIRTSRFLRLDLMMFKSCKCIELSFSWLTISDLDVFMEEWKAGNLPGLRYMLIRSDGFHWNWHDQILGFKRYEMNQLGFRRRLVIDENLSVDCNGGVGIQADNRRKATMQMGRLSPHWFELKLLEIFNLDWSTKWSSTPKAFPLFCLPLLPLIEILKNLDPIELFILSQCSGKSANCVHIVGTKKWKLSVDVGNKVININDSYRVIITESSMKPTWKYDRRMKIFFSKYQYSREYEQELRKVLLKLQAAFRCPVTSFEYDSNQVQPLESFVFAKTLMTEDLEWALQNVKVTQKIDIRICTSRFPGPNIMMFKSCKYIKLQLSWLKICALNGFIEEWKAGNFPNLQYMLIRSEDFKGCWCNHMFRREEMRQLGVPRRLVIDENLSVDCTGGCDIQAVNGSKATMQMDRVSHNSFELFVWNN